MAKIMSNKHSFGFKSANTPVPQSGQYVMHSKMPTTRGKKQVVSAERAPVDDATWDKVVMDLMEEYDEAWTALADK